MDNDITVRAASADDCRRMCELAKSALGYDYSEQKTYERLKIILQRPADRIFVAEYAGETAGYVHGADYECTHTDSLKNIMAIAVDERFRGLGIGKRLLECIENWAKKDGCAGVRLVSSFSRTEAHKFYLHCGYTLRKEQKNFIKIF